MHYGVKIGAKWGKGSSDFYPKQTRSYFSGHEPLCSISSKSNKNCSRRQTDRQTQPRRWFYNISHTMILCAIAVDRSERCLRVHFVSRPRLRQRRTTVLSLTSTGRDQCCVYATSRWKPCYGFWRTVIAVRLAVSRGIPRHLGGAVDSDLVEWVCPRAEQVSQSRSACNPGHRCWMSQINSSPVRR